MLFSLLLLCGSVLGADYRITSVTQFMNFASSVNSGTTYAGTTVYLDANINLSGKTLTPIGNAAKQFRGTFDGQGHIISNLKMTQALRYVGLFGYSDGAAFKNVVLEKTSSITSTCTDQVMPQGVAYLGGIVGYCGTESGPCTVENVINLAKVSFTGSLYDFERMYMGGIAGCLNATNNEISVRNCANYETVSYYCSGSYCFTGPALFGGIVGAFEGNMGKKVQNCLNYGDVTHDGTSWGDVSMGGIVGYASNASYDNCVSGGKISQGSNSQAGYEKYFSSIVGNAVSSDSSISHCYWLYETGYNSAAGNGNPTITDSKLIYPETGPVNDLNVRASLNKWNKWLLNANLGTVIFYVGDSSFSLTFQIILLPNSGSEFKVTWFTDSALENKFTGDEILYSTVSLYCAFTITIKMNCNYVNSSVISEDFIPGREFGELPEPNRTGYNFTGWYTEELDGTEVTPTTTVDSSITEIYAHWVINQYVISFDIAGDFECTCGDVVLDYGTTFELPTPSREGYTFDYWCTDDGLTEEFTETTIPAKNIKLYPKFTINQYTIYFDDAVDFECTCGNITLDYNTTFILPTPSKRGYTFDYWCTDDGLTEEFTETTIPAKNVKLYPKFTVNKYTITFETNGEFQCDPITLDYGTTLTLPTPSREGYRFDYWCTDDGLTKEFTDTAMPDDFITLYPKFTINQYTITFKTNGEFKCDPITLSYGTTFELPTPSREGYTFDYWCTDDGLTKEFTETTIPAMDIELYPKFTINCYTVTFDFGVEKIEKEFDYNETIEFPEDEIPDKEGYAFDGWNEDIAEVPAENITLTAKWVEAADSVDIAFGSKDLNEDGAKAIINKYTDSKDYTVIKFVVEADGVRIIIKFKDMEDAIEFFETFNNSDEVQSGFVRTTKFSLDGSFSSAFYPSLLLGLIF